MKSVTMFWPDRPSCGWVVSTPSMMKRFSEPEAPSTVMPPAIDSLEAPAAWATTEVKSRPRGRSSSSSRRMLVAIADLVTSMTTFSAATVMASSKEPGCRVKLTLRSLPRVSSTPGTSAVTKPSSFAASL